MMLESCFACVVFWYSTCEDEKDCHFTTVQTYITLGKRQDIMSSLHFRNKDSYGKRCAIIEEFQSAIGAIAKNLEAVFK